MADIPVVELSNNSCVQSIEDPDDMCEDRLPDPQLKFVHEIHDK